MAQNVSDSVRTDGIRFGIDVIKLGQGISAGNLNNGLEGFLAWNRNKQVYVVELGTANINKAIANFQESSKGAYIRLGWEKNMMRKGDDQICLGGRLGTSIFQFQAKDIGLTSAQYGNYVITLPAKNAYLFWLEANASARINLTSWLGLGTTIRLQRKIAENFDTYYYPTNIPGYGNFSKTLAFGFNYYAFIHIPFKKYRIPPTELKPRGSK